MRRPLENGTIVKLNNEKGSREVTIVEELGHGSGCYAYKVCEGNLFFVLKECCPVETTMRIEGEEVTWISTEEWEKAKTRFEKAFDIQAELQSKSDSNVKLVDGLYYANNTVYSLSDSNRAKPYDQVTDNNLQEIYKTAKALAEEIGAYHDEGYLHLDIKAQNIMVYEKTREMLLLLDFNSIVSEHALELSDISYSYNYAAPELKQKNIGQVSKATDVYSIGALVFSRIFGRAPESSDRNIFCDWDLDDNPFFAGMSGKAQRLTKVLFHKTLSSNPKQRFQNTRELLAVLQELVKESEPGRRHLNSTLPKSQNTFVGRKIELDSISDAFSNHDCVILHGMGGIGKTELALHYADLFRNSYDTICFGRYSSSLKELFENESFISIENNSETLPGMNSIRGLIDEHTLLIVDNLDSLDEPDFDKLFSLNCKILITSRCDLAASFHALTQIEIGPLAASEQEQLFIKLSGCETNELETVRAILAETEGNTLLIPLIAKQYKNGIYSLEETAEHIYSGGAKVRHDKDGSKYGKVENILAEVFNLTIFTDDKRYVMDSMVILGDIIVEKEQLLSWLGTDYNDTLNELVERNWIQKHGNKYSLHKTVQQVYKNEFDPDAINLPWVHKLCEKYVENAAFLNSQSAQRGRLAMDNEFHFTSYRFVKLSPLNAKITISQEQLIEQVFSNMHDSDKAFELMLNFYLDVRNAPCQLDQTGNNDCILDFSQSNNFINYLQLSGNNLYRIYNSSIFPSLPIHLQIVTLALMTYFPLFNLIQGNYYSELVDSVIEEETREQLNALLVKNSESIRDNVTQAISGAQLAESKIEQLDCKKPEYYKLLLDPFLFLADIFGVKMFIISKHQKISDSKGKNGVRFITYENEYDESSLNDYIDFTLHLIEKTEECDDLKKDFLYSIDRNRSDYEYQMLTGDIEDNYALADEIDEFNEWQEKNSHKYKWGSLYMEDYWSEKILEEGVDKERISIIKKAREINALLRKCFDLGFLPNLSEEGKRVLEEAKKLSSSKSNQQIALKLLNKAKGIAKQITNELRVRDIWDGDYHLDTVEMLINCCIGDNDAAKKSYKNILDNEIDRVIISFQNNSDGLVRPFPVYNAYHLVEAYGYNQLGKWMRLEEIDALEHFRKEKFPVLKSLDGNDVLLNLVSYLLLLSQHLGDDQLIAKYQKELEIVENPSGFTFKE